MDGRSPSLRLISKENEGQAEASSLYLRRQEAQAKNGSDDSATSSPLLSMAVSAAYLDESVTSPTLFMDAQGDSNGKLSSLLLRRRSSKKLIDAQSPPRASTHIAASGSEVVLKDMPSMAVSAAQLNESEVSPLVSLDAGTAANGKGSSLLLRRQSSKKLVAEKQVVSQIEGGDTGAAMTAPTLSMAVSAAQLDDSGVSPTVSLHAGSTGDGKGPNLLLRRQSSKKLVAEKLSPTRNGGQAPIAEGADSSNNFVPILSMAVSAAQLDESGSFPAVSLEAGLAADGKTPGLLLRRQSSKKLTGGN